MSYHLSIISPLDTPLFTHEFGTSRQGGDGIARFREEQRHMNAFIAHSSLDIVDEIQWTSGAMYFKYIDKFYNNYIACFVTGGGVRFLLLHNPDPASSTSSSLAAGKGASGNATSTGAATTSGTGGVAANPMSSAAEEAVRQFFAEVYENWVKAVMNPFFKQNEPLKSDTFRARVVNAGRKYL